ncbi:LCP family protein [Heyndrickxia acidicola]|uniref:LCP family protein n=1 Tax=Heyndrickxia acidicola TaxID=209389 RepID=A0ABU6MDN0_9BACI|nr:LCP family protein [Heyndrickxia acidicola]MED1201778.1 LCP family protein [Heyndrickxia acidicola]
MGRAEKHTRTKRSKLKIFGYSFLSFIVILVAGGSYIYYQLQPKNHFKNVPVVGSTDANASTLPKLASNTFNILLMGSDERKGEKIGHSDSMMLIHVDLNNHQYQAVSIPRDTRVHLAGYGYTKLTSVQYIIQATQGRLEGVKAAVQAIGELTNVPINYYVETNYEGFQSMANAVGNVEVHVPFDVTLTHPWYKANKGKVIPKGTQVLSGQMITELVHERDSLKNTDYGRQQLQEVALEGIAKSALQPGNIAHLPALISSLSDYLVATNMTKEDMISMGLAVKNFNHSQLHYHQLPGASKVMYDDVLKNNNDEVVLDPQEINSVMTKYFVN